jgi:hypothetical protein
MRSLYSGENRRRLRFSSEGEGDGVTWLSDRSDTGFGISIDPVSIALKSMLSQQRTVWDQVDTQGGIDISVGQIDALLSDNNEGPSRRRTNDRSLACRSSSLPRRTWEADGPAYKLKARCKNAAICSRDTVASGQ